MRVLYSFLVCLLINRHEKNMAGYWFLFAVLCPHFTFQVQKQQKQVYLHYIIFNELRIIFIYLFFVIQI